MFLRAQLVLSVLLAGAALAAGARDAIEKVNARFGEAIGKGDAATIASLYTDDAVLLPPGTPMLKGPKAIAEFWKGGFADGIKEGKLTTVDVEETGDVAVEIGTFTMTIHPEGQEAVKDSGQYIVTWKKGEDGTYRLHRDIWNSTAGK